MDGFCTKHEEKTWTVFKTVVLTCRRQRLCDDCSRSGLLHPNRGQYQGWNPEAERLMYATSTHIHQAFMSAVGDATCTSEQNLVSGDAGSKHQTPGKWNGFVNNMESSVGAPKIGFAAHSQSPQSQVILTGCRLFGGSKYRLFVYVEAMVNI